MIEPEPELSDYQQLASEVKQLTAERDYLLAQARKESESLERKETVIKAQFEEQLQELANKISQVILVSSQRHNIKPCYYIDTSVLLENIPLVKFIKTTSRTRVVYFPKSCT